METFAKILEFMKVPVRYFIGFACVTAFILFAPDSIIENIGLLKHREESKLYLGLSLMISVAIVISSFVGVIVDKFNDYLFVRAGKKRLLILTAEEKQILNGYIESNSRTRYLSCQSGVVKGLVHENIIYRSSDISSPMHGAFSFAYNIQPWAWKILNNQSNLLSQNETL